MKKLLAILLAALMVLSFAACQTTPTEPAPEETTAAPEETDAPVEDVVLEDTESALWTAHGQYLLADGTENGWNGKDAALYEAAALTAIKLSDVKAISEDLYNTLKEKDVKYLYTIDLLFGTNDAGWTSNFLKDGKLYRANGSYCVKIAKCAVEVDGEDKIYSELQWISDPKTAYAEALTPDTMFYPTWQEEKDENGFAWDQNPVVIGGAGLYTLVIAQYNTVSAAGTPGYGVGLVMKEEKDGIAYEEIVTYVPADHTYGIIGGFAGSDWSTDVEMTEAGEGVWTGEATLAAENEWKVRADGEWTHSWGVEGYNGANFKAEEDGTYVITITFEGETGTVTFEKKAE